ncbi:MAG TPA: hypothetical protein VG944_08705 [Fimbriimonas sp.]|nr:hypothetical protein [Fimbriimonas sp.]
MKSVVGIIESGGGGTPVPTTLGVTSPPNNYAIRNTSSLFLAQVAITLYDFEWQTIYWNADVLDDEAAVLTLGTSDPLNVAGLSYLGTLTSVNGTPLGVMPQAYSQTNQGGVARAQIVVSGADVVWSPTGTPDGSAGDNGNGTTGSGPSALSPVILKAGTTYQVDGSGAFPTPIEGVGTTMGFQSPQAAVTWDSTTDPSDPAATFIYAVGGLASLSVNLSIDENVTGGEIGFGVAQADQIFTNTQLEQKGTFSIVSAVDLATAVNQSQPINYGGPVNADSYFFVILISPITTSDGTGPVSITVQASSIPFTPTLTAPANTPSYAPVGVQWSADASYGTVNANTSKASRGFSYHARAWNFVSGLRILMLFDNDIPPINGDTPIREFPMSSGVADGPTEIDEYYGGDGGVLFTNGVSWAISTTSGTLTLATASDCWAEVEYR